jgi:hypothetical protein
MIHLTDRRRSGFNLVETIVASVILSGAVLALGAISSRGLTDTRLNRHYEVAASVIDKQLTLIDSIGIDQFIEQGQSEGTIEELDPGYTWAVGTEYYGVDNVYLVTITVQWLEHNRPRQVVAQTMLNGATTVATQTTQER